VHFHYLSLLGIGESTYQSAIDILKNLSIHVINGVFCCYCSKTVTNNLEGKNPMQGHFK